MKRFISLFIKLNTIFLAELQCQAEILDLLPSIEEANMISIAMDKKIKFSAIAVSAESR